MARKIENAFTDLKRRMKRGKRVYPLKTCLPSRNPYTPAKTWLARVNRTKTWLTNVKTCLSTKNVPRKGRSFLPKRLKQRRKSVSRVNTPLNSENALTGRKFVYRAKTSLANGEKTFCEGKRASQRRKGVYIPPKGENSFT